LKTEVQKQLELLKLLFDAARDDHQKEWSDEAYILAGIIKDIAQTTEEKFTKLVLESAVDTLVKVYGIPKNTATKYVKDPNSELVPNLIDRIREILLFEIENWIPSTDILSYR
jgi:hypothetical protein